jgi:hypothetical protein
MKKRPRFPNGLKLIVEDAQAVSDLAGKADDVARAPLGRVFIEGTDRKAWIEPWSEGPLVVTNGATGKVNVKPFWIHMSPGGATVSAGTEDATGSSETLEDVQSAFFPGGTMDVPVPVPSAAHHRWDLLYAIVSVTDSDSATRMIKDPISKVSSPKAVFTRTKAVCTLAWVQGTIEPTATDPYPAPSLPVLPGPASLQAHAPLAYVNVQNSGTPTTVTYDKKRIANAPRLWRHNQKSGAAIVASAPVSGKASLAASIQGDAATIITTASAQGGWDPAAASRPARFIEPMTGAIDLLIPFGPGSATPGNRTFGSAFSSSVLLPVASPVAGVLRDGVVAVDWRDRVFHGHLVISPTGQRFAWDPAASGTGNYHPMTATTGSIMSEGWGQSMQGVDAFDTDIGSSLYFVACYFRSIGGAGNDVCVIVRKSDGAMFLVARESVVDFLGYAVGTIQLRAFDRVGPNAIG